MNTTPAIRAILFDLDGVVIDSEPLHEEAQRIVFSRFDLSVPEDAFADFKGMTEVAVFDRIVAEYTDGATDAGTLVAEKHATFRDLLDDVPLVPGVRDFLEHVQQRYRLALTTSSIRDNQQRAVERHALAHFFEVVVTAEDITRAKPDPEPYRLTAARLGVSPSACLVIEDSVHGVRSGVAAGCTVAGLTTTFDAHTLGTAGAHLTVDGYGALADWLAGRGGG